MQALFHSISAKNDMQEIHPYNNQKHKPLHSISHGLFKCKTWMLGVGIENTNFNKSIYHFQQKRHKSIFIW